MYNIRKATVFDADQIAILGEDFFKYSAFTNFIQYDIESTKENILKILTQGVIFIAEKDTQIVGFIIGIIAPVWFNSNSKLATELAWYISEEHRKTTVAIRLYKTFEEWGHNNGADAIVMSDLTIDGVNPAGNLFEKLGFTVVERSHIKKRG